jgi:hypothetical protein
MSERGRVDRALGLDVVVEPHRCSKLALDGLRVLDRLPRRLEVDVA